ncbi:MAG: hypothetical protein SGJ24_16320, partial [Chloroflexota bacterium]|nr:hypothetical protein [Chloroflexota bacterium]
HACQEIRSSGAGAAWACRLGRLADDGTFADFQARALAQPPQGIADGAAWDGLVVQWGES